MGKKSDSENWEEFTNEPTAYRPTSQNPMTSLPDPTPAEPDPSAAEPASISTDVTPAPSVDEAVWDGTNWTHSGRVWDGERWVASPELLADRRARATEKFQLSVVRLLKSLIYAVLALIVVTAIGAALFLMRPQDHEIGTIIGLSVAGLFALVSLIYLWGRNRSRP